MNNSDSDVDVPVIQRIRQKLGGSHHAHRLLVVVLKHHVSCLRVRGDKRKKNQNVSKEESSAQEEVVSAGARIKTVRKSRSRLS